MNSGKEFERQFRKSAKKNKEIFYYKLKDSPSAWGSSSNSVLRFTNDNICDVIMFKAPILFLLELKAHTGSSLPFNCIRKNQIDGLLEASNYENIVPGVICSFTEKERCFFLDIKKLKELQDSKTRKSVPIKYFEEFGVEIEVKKLRVSMMYDVNKFVESFVFGRKSNEQSL